MSHSYKTLDAARDIGKLREGRAVLLIMKAYGINTVSRVENGSLQETCSIDRMLEEMKEE